MNRATIHTLVRKRINEATADQWSDADVNSAINVGYQQMEMVILESDPDAFIKVDRAALVVTQHEYAKPASLIHEIDVSILDSVSGDYDVIKMGNYHDVRGRGSSEVQQYAHYGRYIFLGPAPDAALAAGLQIVYVPALVLSVAASVPQLAQAYHTAIVISAAITLIGETADGIDKMMKERDYAYGRLRVQYRKTTAPSHFQIDQSGSMRKPY